MTGIPAGAIVHVGGRTVLNRLQNAGLQDPRVPTETVYETGNNLVVGKVLTEADFRFQMTSWDVSTDLLALLNGKKAAAIGDQISEADADGTVYKWENCGFIDVVSPWKSNTGSQGGNVAAGIIVPNLYPTALSYRLGVTQNAEMQVTLSTGSYYMSKAAPYQDWAVGDGATAAYVTAYPARVYRIGGAGSATYQYAFGVMVNGVPQIRGVDYVESGGAGPEPGGGDTVVTLTFVTPPPADAVVTFCYFSGHAQAIPQAYNLDTTVLPAAVRGRNITLLIGDPHGSPLVFYGVQSYELQASVSGQLQREMGTQDPIGFSNTGIDANGTVTVEPKDIDHLFSFLSESLGVDESEVYGPINTQTFPLTAIIHDPKHPTEIIKSIFVPDAFLQLPGEQARVRQVTQFPVRFESMTGTFHEVKGDLPTVGE